MNLTSRQREVLELIAAGKQSHEIAAELGLSTHTVKLHRNKLYRQMGIHDKTQTIIVAWLRGWIH